MRLIYVDKNRDYKWNNNYLCVKLVQMARKFTLLVVALVLMTACSGRVDSYRRCSGSVWATAYNVVYSGGRDLDDSMMVVMRRVERSLSPFDKESVISRINRGESVRVDTMLRRVFETSQYVCRISGGVFDPTVAPLVNLWGFGYDNAAVEPSQKSIDSALTHVGLPGCRLDADTIERLSEHTEFNFSAITKGYGCDMVGEMLFRNGCADYMVEIGGEIAVRGKNPRGEKWHIQIDAPVEGMGVGEKSMGVIELTDAGMATSGNYRNYRTTPSGKVWHTIDPRTGRPAETTTLSATVIAPTCMMADALATACMAMMPSDALAMINGVEGVEALLVVRGDVDGDMTVRSTAGFPPFVK